MTDTGGETHNGPADPLGTLVSGHLQRVEIALLARILATTLAGALPPAMIDVDTRRTLGDRLARRPGVVVGVSIHTPTRTLTFRARAVGDVKATVDHRIHGVTISHQRVTVAHWLDELAMVLDAVAAEDDSTRAALERVLR